MASGPSGRHKCTLAERKICHYTALVHITFQNILTKYLKIVLASVDRAPQSPAAGLLHPKVIVYVPLALALVTSYLLQNDTYTYFEQDESFIKCVQSSPKNDMNFRAVGPRIQNVKVQTVRNGWILSYHLRHQTHPITHSNLTKFMFFGDAWTSKWKLSNERAMSWKALPFLIRFQACAECQCLLWVIHAVPLTHMSI